MRPAQKSNRSRGRGNRKSGGGGGGNNLNRVFDSAGPEGKVRGTPQQIIDKYVSLARDAQTSGDRVTAENFLQHAEHYQRILIQAMGAQEQARREQAAQNEQPAEQPNVAESSEEQRDAKPKPPAQQPEAEIGGMAMIDSDTPADSLLVDAGEMQPPPQRRNGGGRRPAKPRAEKTSAPAEGPSDPPQQEKTATAQKDDTASSTETQTN